MLAVPSLPNPFRCRWRGLSPSCFLPGPTYLFKDMGIARLDPSLVESQRGQA